MAGPATGTLASDPATFPPRVQEFGTYDATGPRAAATGSYREWVGAHGQIFFEYYIDELLAVAGATATTTALIPAGTTDVTIATRVTTTLTGNSVANYDIGVTGSATLFTSNYTSITAGDTCAISAKMTAALNAAAVGILITPDQTTTAGAIRIVAKCVGVRPPTS